MDTDERPDLQRGGESKLILKAETEKIIGFAFEVLNEVGHGLYEKVYENSLVVLFKHGGVAFDQQRRFPVCFRGVEVGEFVPDLIAFGSVKVSYAITAQGKIVDVRVRTNTSNESLARICEQSIREAEVGPPPDEAQAAMSDGRLEGDLTFTYYNTQ